ncbi:MAG TPA: hypothetical protein VGR73_07755 [Bryobacteraceae bacterium]|nr:hypothetical protein [Bryobacteraceae bacterium]
MDKVSALEQINRAIDRYYDLKSKSEYDDCSDQPDNDVSGLITTLATTIERVAPAGGHCRKSLEKVIAESGPSNPYLLTVLPGLLQSLKRDYIDGTIGITRETAANSAEPLTAPEKVTIRWLIDHVGWGAWTVLGTIVLGAFLGGVSLGQVAWVRELFHAPQSPEPSAGARQPLDVQMDALNKGHNERVLQLQKGIIEEESGAGSSFDSSAHRAAAVRLREDLKAENEAFERELTRLKAPSK